MQPGQELCAGLRGFRAGNFNYEATARGILIEDKDRIRNRIRRPPDKGDAVVMCE
jgi:hypothetical protein